MSKSEPAQLRVWFWLCAVLTVFKFWLTRAQPVYAIGNAALDDRLFLELAQSIVRDGWLGAYNQNTLAKGAAFPLWIALVFWIGLPLGLAQQALYATACGLFTRACRPALSSAAARAAVYLLLLWNPMSFEAHTLARIIRQNIYTPLGIMIFAGWVALYFRRSERFRQQLPWAMLAGFSTGVFWLTREESIWILPSILLLAAAVLYGAKKTSPAAFKITGYSLLLSALCWAIPILLVSWQNQKHYGWFGTVEFKSKEFKDAYGAMLRVRIGPELRQVPVTRQAREAMYAVSPTFAKLRPQLEGPIGDGWSEKELFPAAERQIRGGWLMWALRDAVAATGNAPDAKTALRFYESMAQEINRACEDGRLPARSARSTLLPPWREGQTAETIRVFLFFADFVGGFRSFDVRSPLSVGDHDELLLFHDLTRDRITSSPQSAAMPLVNQETLNEHKFLLLHRIGYALCQALFVLLLAAHFVVALRVFQVIRSRQLTYPLVLAAAAWGGGVAYLLVNSLVHVTSFSVTAVSTFSPIYPLLLIFIVAATWDAMTAWFKNPTPQ
jgi:hypothetical protein